MPGEYVVNGQINPTLETGSASPDAAAPRDAYPSTFYPGTPNVNEAQAITLGIGEEFGLSFGLVSARLARVSGTARDSEGRPLTGQAYLMPRDPSQPGTALRGTIASDGSFTIAGVPPGEYTLGAMRTPAVGNKSAVPEFGSVPLTVSGTDIGGLRVTASRGTVVSGQVAWEGSAPKPGTPRLAVFFVNPASSALAAAVDPNMNGQIDGDGNFQIGGVFGRVILTTSGVRGWAIKSVRLDGRDITQVPIDTLGRSAIDGLQVVMTDKSSTLTGSVTDDRGAAATQFVVVVQPADDLEPAVAGRYVRTMRSDTNGRFEFRDLRPGRYVATAIEALEQGRQVLAGVPETAAPRRAGVLTPRGRDTDAGAQADRRLVGRELRRMQPSRNGHNIARHPYSRIGFQSPRKLSHQQDPMSSRKLNEIASDVDDASTVVDELQADPDADTWEKLGELKKTLEDASDTLDELAEEDKE